MAEKSRKNANAYLVKPASRMGGLDYLHISLIVLVLILVALVFSLSYFRRGVELTNCTYGIVNSTCALPKYSSSQALSAAEKILANYQYVNSSLSILPFYLEINRSTISYQNQSNSWIVITPYINPLDNNMTFYFEIVLNGANLSLEEPFIQTISPSIYSNYSVESFGVLNDTKALCTEKTPIPIYLITDPYAPGALSGISTAIKSAKEYGNKINVSYYITFTDYSENLYSKYGVNATQRMGYYLACASVDSNFSGFVSGLQTIYTGTPIANYTLYSIVVSSGINTSSFDRCIGNVTTALDHQSQLASFYKIKSTPELIVDCKYVTIPQTLNNAINYTLKNLSGS